MIEDLRELAHDTALSADVCLIGAGAAGITIARELSRHSLSVCLLEGGGLQYEYLESQLLYQGSNRGVPVLFEGGRLRYFGGTTNHWGGRCAPLQPLDFAHRDWIEHSGWPLDRGELDPYYLRSYDVAGFASPWRSDQDTLSLLGVALPTLDTRWLQPFLWHYTPAMKDAAVWRWSNAYLQEVRDSKQIRALLHANFNNFTADKSRRTVRSVTAKSLNGNAATVSAHAFVLCCGGIENARVLLLAAEDGGGFGNQHDLVGRYLMQHSRGPAGTIVSPARFGSVEHEFNILSGPDGLEVEIGVALSEQAQADERLLNCSGVMQYQGDPTAGVAVAQDIWRSLKEGHWAAQMGEKVGLIAEDFPEVLKSVRHRLASGHSLDRENGGVPSHEAVLLLDLEQAPDPDSRIMLGSDRDPLGLKRVEADWRIGELERRTAMKFTGYVASEFARLGIGRCRLEPWLQDAKVPMTDALRETYHYLGTTRMAESADHGVVDRNCQVHGMDNLFVAGSSVFPTAGQANPTLTILALALRLADHLRR